MKIWLKQYTWQAASSINQQIGFSLWTWIERCPYFLGGQFIRASRDSSKIRRQETTFGKQQHSVLYPWDKYTFNPDPVQYHTHTREETKVPIMHGRPKRVSSPYPSRHFPIRNNRSYLEWIEGMTMRYIRWFHIWGSYATAAIRFVHKKPRTKPQGEEGLGSASQPGDSTHYPNSFLHPFQVPTRRDWDKLLSYVISS